MRRPVAAALLAVLLVASASPVAAHGNHVEADSQYSADGTVVVEAVRPLTDGFLVLHRETADGDLGEPIGHTSVDVDDGFQRGVPVRMDDDAWADWPRNGTVWVVFHADDGDGEFTPGEDPATSAFGRVTGTTLTLGKADRPARVLAERSAPQQTASATATVAEVALPEDGFLVLRTGDGTDGQVVGARALDAGVHEDVALEFDPDAFAENQSTVGLYAQLYTDDGDGEFAPGEDSLVRAGDEPVRSYFLVWQVENATATTDEPVVRTPTDGNDVVTPTSAASTDGTTAQSGHGGTTDAPTEGESESTVPGFGLGHAVLAVLAGVVVLARLD